MRTVSLLSVVVVGVLFSPQAFVQNAPGTPMSAEEIIKQLAPPDPAATPAPAQGTEGRTRSLRNLKPVARIGAVSECGRLDRVRADHGCSVAR